VRPPGRYRLRGQNDCEKRASRNSPSFAAALNCGIGSSSLNADVNAFERLQMVRGVNSSYSVRSRVHGRSGRDVSAFQFAFDECLVDDHFYRDIGQLSSLPRFHLLTHIGSKLRYIRSTPTEMQSISENDFEESSALVYSNRWYRIFLFCRANGASSWGRVKTT
jgi:hypothetical protein